jgi:hypothetical protein
MMFSKLHNPKGIRHEKNIARFFCPCGNLGACRIGSRHNHGMGGE